MPITLSSDIHSPQQYSYPRRDKFNHLRVKNLCKELTPLSIEYRDPRGYFIQLWKTIQYGLIGSIYDLTGKLKIIPSHKIRNPLNALQSSRDLLHTLENAPNTIVQEK